MLKGAWSEADKVQTVQATCMHSAAQRCNARSQQIHPCLYKGGLGSPSLL